MCRCKCNQSASVPVRQAWRRTAASAVVVAVRRVDRVTATLASMAGTASVSAPNWNSTLHTARLTTQATRSAQTVVTVFVVNASATTHRVFQVAGCLASGASATPSRVSGMPRAVCAGVTSAADAAGASATAGPAGRAPRASAPAAGRPAWRLRTWGADVSARGTATVSAVAASAMPTPGDALQGPSARTARHARGDALSFAAASSAWCSRLGICPSRNAPTTAAHSILSLSTSLKVCQPLGLTASGTTG